MKLLERFFYPKTDPSPAQYQSSQRILLAQGAVAAVLFSLGTGNFLAGYLGTLGAAPAQIAQIMAIPQLGCVLQLLSPLFFERKARRKLSVVGMCFLFRFSVGFSVFAPYLFAEKQQRLTFVFLLYGMAFLLAGFVTPALNQWVMQIAPAENRGSYFAKKDVIALVANSLIAFLMGRQLDAHTVQGDPLKGYLAIYGFCIIGAVLDLALMLFLHEPKSPALHNIRFADLLAPVREKRFRPLLVYELLSYSAMMFSSGYLSVYQLTQLHLTHTFITTVGIVTSVVGMASIWVWGRVADRTYWTTALLGTRVISTLCLFGWWLLPRQWAPFAAPLIMAFSAAGSGAAGMAGVNLQYDCSPPAGKTAYLGVTAATASLMGYGAALLGSRVQQWLEPVLGGQSMAVLFAVSGVLSAITLLYGWLRLPRAPLLYAAPQQGAAE